MSQQGIANKYKGRQFRSLLETRWAAFFDLLGWSYEYEPFELPGWIPDFVLLGHTQNILVEVKPYTFEDEFPVAKIASAMRQAGRTGEVLLAPATLPSTQSGLDYQQVGWLLEFHPHFGDSFNSDEAIIAWYGTGRDEGGQGKDLRGVGQHGLTVAYGGWSDRISGRYEGGGPGRWRNNHAAEIQQLWVEAGNIAQWNKPKKKLSWSEFQEALRNV